jgi:hypothetical protein
MHCSTVNLITLIYKINIYTTLTYNRKWVRLDHQALVNRITV